MKVVNAIIPDKERKRFLIIKRKRGKGQLHPGKWAFPGGIVEKGESNEQALKREIKEETGMKIKKILKKISDYNYKRPNKQNTYGSCYLVLAEPKKVILGKEIESFNWVTIEEFEKFNFISGLDEEVMKALF